MHPSPVASLIPLVNAFCEPKLRLWVMALIRGLAWAIRSRTSCVLSGLPSLTKMIS